ncbi:MAG: N-acetyltransferase [Clostridiales bacterium]|nr:N-acetyltransferase [Clostridiales bacterium]
MHIRNATIQDLPAIMDIFETARDFMRKTGNPTQWPAGYPSEEMIRNETHEGNLYVITEEGEIVGVFAFILGEDPTYRVIKDGQWRSDKPYGTIHRLASSGRVKGVARRCFDFCREKCPHLRIDTHRDNKPMQAAILSYGFKPCGIIYTHDGTERLAYDYL